MITLTFADEWRSCILCKIVENLKKADNNAQKSIFLHVKNVLFLNDE